MNLNTLLKDKNVLRLVVILSIFNLLGYVMVKDVTVVIFFLLVGYLTTYFSKNMIVVLLVAIVFSNLFAFYRNTEFKEKRTEGMANENKSTKKKSEETDDYSQIDHSKTLDSMMANLEATMEPEELEKMSKVSERLVGQQKILQKNIRQMAPMINESMKTIESLGGAKGLANMAGQIDSVMKTLGNTLPAIKKE